MTNETKHTPRPYSPWNQPGETWEGHPIRKARKAHRCNYWWGKNNHPNKEGRCQNVIKPGDLYLEGEMNDEAGGYGADRYCAECAEISEYAPLSNWHVTYFGDYVARVFQGHEVIAHLSGRPGSAYVERARLIAAAPDLLEACEAQHEAIDILFAMLIEARTGFLPTKSGKPWEACLKGNAAIAKATGKAGA